MCTAHWLTLVALLAHLADERFTVLYILGCINYCLITFHSLLLDAANNVSWFSTGHRLSSKSALRQLIETDMPQLMIGLIPCFCIILMHIMTKLYSYIDLYIQLVNKLDDSIGFPWFFMDDISKYVISQNIGRSISTLLWFSCV